MYFLLISHYIILKNYLLIHQKIADDVRQKEDDVKEINEAYDHVLAACEKFPDELSDKYDLDKENEAINKQYKDLNDEVKDMADKCSSTKKRYQIHVGKLDDGKALLDQVDGVKKIKAPVGIDPEATEKFIENIQVRVG